MPWFSLDVILKIKMSRSQQKNFEVFLVSLVLNKVALLFTWRLKFFRSCREEKESKNKLDFLETSWILCRNINSSPQHQFKVRMFHQNDSSWVWFTNVIKWICTMIDYRYLHQSRASILCYSYIREKARDIVCIGVTHQ